MIIVIMIVIFYYNSDCNGYSDYDGYNCDDWGVVYYCFMVFDWGMVYD